MEIDFKETVKKCFSKTDFARALGYNYFNGTVSRKINNIIKINNLDITHFDHGKSKNTKYPKIEKQCPVCNKKFEAKLGEKREKQTCSYSCSNKFFRTGLNNGKAKLDGLVSYRWICFSKHKKECIICGEKNIISVHHYDEDHKNNEVSNLIPMCPTHHQYMHSNFKHLIEEKVKSYMNKFIGVW